MIHTDDVPMPDFQNLDDTEVTTYLCESCGITAELTQQAAFNEGWDYPPIMFPWNVLQPHTCGECGIDTTLWWQVMLSGGAADFEAWVATLDQRHQDTWLRIKEEMVNHSE